MRTEKDAFRRSMYDKEQLSMKVLCNATYGFCGADGKGALLAVRTVMYLVTSIGRYLQKQSSHHLAEYYGIPTIYGDTDSVFVHVDHRPPEQQQLPHDAEQVTAYVQHRYGLNIPGRSPGEAPTWPDVVAWYRLRHGLDVAAMDPAHQVNAVLYLVYHKLCAEVSALFRPDIVLEMENMSDNVWMSDKKKHYCYRMWNPSNPSCVYKTKITGMAAKKREYTPWTREVLLSLTDRLLQGKDSTVRHTKGVIVPVV